MITKEHSGTPSVIHACTGKFWVKAISLGVKPRFQDPHHKTPWFLMSVCREPVEVECAPFTAGSWFKDAAAVEPHSPRYVWSHANS